MTDGCGKTSRYNQNNCFIYLGNRVEDLHGTFFIPNGDNKHWFKAEKTNAFAQSISGLNSLTLIVA